MKLINLFGFFVLLMVSCQSAQKEQVLRGEGIYISSGKVYLSLSRDFETIIDSSIVVDGKFEFKFEKPIDLQSVILTFKTKEGKNNSIAIFNPYEVSEDGKYSKYAYFMLEKGETVLTGDKDFNEIEATVRINEGIENALFLKSKRRNIGYINKDNEDTYKQSIARVERLVKVNPESFYLLAKIDEAKIDYRKTDLEKVLSLFDNSVKESGSMDRFREYLKQREETDGTRAVLSLTNDKGKYVTGVDRGAPLNMLVFWASWCGPCRLEIPQLKEIQKEFKNAPFKMVSISMDKSQKDWGTAMEDEEMDWDQYIVTSDSIPIIYAKYNFDAIPLVIFTDSNGKELKRFQGYYNSNISRYTEFINGFNASNVR